MPVVTIERPRTLCPPGPQTFVLADVTPQIMPSFDGTGEVERWIWRFVGSQKDAEGQFYEVNVFTGQSYGNSRAKLTWLLDLMVPGITKQQADRLDTDTLLGTHYEGSVKHEQAMRDPEKKVTTFAYLRPLQDEAVEGDPFAADDPGSVQVCDECGVEVDANMAAKAIKRFGVILCHRDGRARMENDKVAAGAPAVA